MRSVVDQNVVMRRMTVLGHAVAQVVSHRPRAQENPREFVVDKVALGRVSL